MARPWIPLRLSPVELRCQVTLTNGQSFAWQPTAFNADEHARSARPNDDDAATSATSSSSSPPLPIASPRKSSSKFAALPQQRPIEWCGVLGTHIVRFKESETDTLFRVENPSASSTDAAERAVRDYLRADASLEELVVAWTAADTRFSQISPYFMGCRLLRQDPIECLFSFLCSSNNNIPRITKMLEALRVNFGTRLGEVGGRTYHSFPTLSQLLDATEPRLRALGFGYRAKFIVQSAQFIAAQPGGAEWLRALRDRTREEAHAELLKLCGVGPKVADCVSLFCLDKLDVVPVDVHVWKIAAVDYGAEFEAGFAERTLTKRVYASVGDFFRRRLGTHCGWAHSILFTADLHAFQSRLPVALRRTLPAVVASGAKNKAKAKAKAKAKSAADEATETMSELKEEDASSVQPSAAAAVASTKGGRKRKTELAVKSEAASSDEHIAAPKEASKKPRKSAAPKSALKSET